MYVYNNANYTCSNTIYVYIFVCLFVYLFACFFVSVARDENEGGGGADTNEVFISPVTGCRVSQSLTFN
jgi:hypothetical protein